MSFKIIAIRPLKDCNPKFLKNLNPGEIYKFYNDYEFNLDQNKNDVIQIVNSSTVPENLFDVIRIEKNPLTDEIIDRTISVNISAIVGKNGSGKSSLSDLFLICIFYVSNKLGFVHKNEFLDDSNLSEKHSYNKDIKDIESGVCAEIYYSIEKKIFKFRIESNIISIEEAQSVKDEFIFNLSYKKINEKSELHPFFYSMIINYSIYGFNSNSMGVWIKAVFHKNDGYQMPIVISPYKNDGNIDINIETYLTRSRVLSNLITIKNYKKKINPKSEVKTIELFFDINKNYEHEVTDDERNIYREKIIIPLYNKMFLEQFTYPNIDSEINKMAEYYLIHKFKSITNKYSIFREFKNAVIENTGDKFIDAIFKNRTHITLKVFQTLNFINENIFKFDNINLRSELDISYVEKRIADKREFQWFTQTVEYLPPPFFVSNVIFKDNSSFDDLSSGEKQKIFALNSIIYHCTNLDSVSKHHLKDENKPIIYSNINLILDEIELYYHPEFQRNFISELLKFIKNAKFKSIKNINIIFITHSPFILSDIPKKIFYF